MTFCLYECLEAVGLQRHYARFTSAGVCRAAHLSSLTIEDYPHLGICTMEDKYRLFDLVQLIKSLDLDPLEYDDGDGNNWDHNVNDGDEDYTGVNGSFNHHSYGNPVEDRSDEEEETDTIVRRSCIRRQLNFSDENIDPYHNPTSRSVSSHHVHASNNVNTKQVKGKESVVSLKFVAGNPVVCSCKENNKHKPDVFTYPSNHHRSESIKLGIAGGKSMYSSDSRLPSRSASFHQPKPNSKTFSSVSSNDKSFRYKNRKGCSRKQSFHTDIDKKGSIGRMAQPTLVYEAKRTTGYNYGLPLTSPLGPSKKQAKEQHISVCVRKRPLTGAEKRRKEADVVTTTDRDCVIVHEEKEAVDLTQYILQHRFYFDYVFGEESSNEEVYRKTAYPLVQHMLSGGKSTCFAYGQTGAGKTHTMLGSSTGRPGLYALAVQDIFTHLSTSHTHLSLQVYVSFFEIYCGQLYDLLNHKKRLFAREDGHKIVHISGLRDVKVDSINSLLEVISQGTEERTQGMSGVNPISSRSHALLQIQLRDENQQIAGRMWFVDLAGSERASDTKEPDKHSRMEGAEINQSLLALKECIRSLDQEQSHTPFRQSKLTQVLKDSFVGNSMTCMIANISPGHTATEHTLNTLRYADRVKELKGQRGPRGRRGSKTMPFSTYNPPHSFGSGGSGGATRGKSPPKKPKLGKLKEDFCPIAPATRGLPGRNIFCSTPKHSRRGDEANATHRDQREIGLEHVSPVRGWLVKEDRHWEASEGKCRKIEKKKNGATSSHYVGEPIVQGGPINQTIDSWTMLKERAPHGGNLSSNKTKSEFHNTEKVNQKSRTNEDNGEDRKWIELRKQVKTSRDAANSAERNTDEGSNEREMHLRRYHEQLQTFIPSSNLYFDLFSSSAQSSVSTSEAASSAPHLSCHSVNTQGLNGLEEVLAGYPASAVTKTNGDIEQLPSSGSEVHLQTETLIVDENNTGIDGEDCTVPQEVTGERSGQDRVKGEMRRLRQAMGEVKVRRRDRGPAGVEIPEMRWAWETTAETKPANTMTGAISTHVVAQASNNCDSGDRREVGVDGRNASHGPADGVWSTQGAADRYSLESAQSSSFSNQPLFGSPHQQAPAERPLSPAREHSNTFLTSDQLQNLSLDFKHTDHNTNIMQLPQQNETQTAPSNRHREEGLWFSANVRGGPFAHATALPRSTSTLQSGCTLSTVSMDKLFEHQAQGKQTKTSVFPKVEAHAESSSYIMDPLSISLLQTDQRAATVSFLQGEISNAPDCLFESESGDDNSRKGEKVCLSCADVIRKVKEDENEEFNLSLLRLPQITHQQQKMLDSLASREHTEKLENCRKEKNEPDEVWQESLPNQDNYQNPQMTSSLSNKDPASPLQATTHSFVKTMPSDTSRVKSQEKRHNQQIKPIIHLFSPDDLDQAKWGIIEAHWEQLKEMEALSRKEGMLLCQQPDMTFGEYVHKLEELMERKAECVHSMRIQLQPYLKSFDSQHSHQH